MLLLSAFVLFRIKRRIINLFISDRKLQNDIIKTAQNYVRLDNSQEFGPVKEQFAQGLTGQRIFKRSHMLKIPPGEKVLQKGGPADRYRKSVPNTD